MVNQVIDKDLPDFKIENGELKADIDQPIEKEEGNALFVFDPNSTDLEKYQNKTGLFVLKDKVVSMGNGQIQTYSYNDLLGASLEKKIYKNLFLYSIIFIRFYYLLLILSVPIPIIHYFCRRDFTCVHRFCYERST